MKLFKKLNLILCLSLFVGCSNYLQEIKKNVDDIEVTYTVEHYLQNLDEQSYDLYEKETKKGLSLSKTDVTPKEYDGFISLDIEQQVINRDGSTKLKVFYNRKLITYSFISQGGVYNNNTEDIVITGLFGQEVKLPSNPQKVGYNFGEYNQSVPLVFGSEDLIFNAIWLPADGTSYKVEHYLQNIENDEYTINELETEYKTGITDSPTSAISKDFQGFTTKEFAQKLIAPDGSTVVQIQYDRNIIEYVFKTTDGTFSDNSTTKSISGRYDATVNAPENLKRTGYEFNTWDPSLPSNFGFENKEFKAIWKPNTYKIVFNSNGGSGSMENEIYSYDEEKSLTANSFTRTTWGFAGWNTASNGNGKNYTDKESIKNLTTINNDTITLYATWTYPNTLSHQNNTLGFVCDDIKLTYEFIIKASKKNYSKTITRESGQSVPDYSFSDVPVEAVADGVEWTLSVTAKNTQYNLNYSGTYTTKIKDRILNLKMPTMTKQ